MPPFFILAGHTQTTNEHNQFSLMVVEVCEISVMKDINAVLLNDSKDGVAFKEQFNKTITISYLVGGNKYLSMSDSNHNSKNCRGQMVSGTSAASIQKNWLIHGSLKWRMLLKSFILLIIGLEI